MFELPSLLYPYDALEPHIDAETLEIHHGRHHATYVQNLNAALEGTKWAKRPLAQILDNLDSLPQDMRMPVRNNGGGHANHSLFWTIMAPEAGGEPAGDIGRAISDSFDSFARFKEQFTGAATRRFGSGWAWLIHDGTGLAVVSTPNQDSPLMQGDVPLLGLDVWEHSYYLRYQNRRIDYIEAWWNLVDWTQVEANLQLATARPASLTV